MKRLVLIPFIGGVVVAAGMALTEPATSRFYRAALIAAALLTAGSALITTHLFAKSDKLFAAWLLIGSGYGLAAIRYSLRLVTMFGGPELLGRAALDTLLIMQNLLIAIALWLFVRSWRATGLATPFSGAARTGWTLLGVGVAVIVGGYPLIQGFVTAKADTVLLVSTLGDMVGIALIVPLAMSALAMRGGLLMHTWLYLAACEAFWLLYDVWLALRTTLGIDAPLGPGIEQVIRIIAILFAFIATVAQRRALRR
ncbi:MAG TPA: hypothetical protein VJ276_17070 [Thermoanaerobaculia bacterium]|nr:hypothetical protein [Thermoanaerobaculia bacterium]